jgi:hypothetical protein
MRNDEADEADEAHSFAVKAAAIEVTDPTGPAFDVNASSLGPTISAPVCCVPEQDEGVKEGEKTLATVSTRLAQQDSATPAPTEVETLTSTQSEVVPAVPSVTSASTSSKPSTIPNSLGDPINEDDYVENLWCYICKKEVKVPFDYEMFSVDKNNPQRVLFWEPHQCDFHDRCSDCNKEVSGIYNAKTESFDCSQHKKVCKAEMGPQQALRPVSNQTSNQHPRQSSKKEIDFCGHCGNQPKGSSFKHREACQADRKARKLPLHSFDRKTGKPLFQTVKMRYNSGPRSPRNTSSPPGKLPLSALQSGMLVPTGTPSAQNKVDASPIQSNMPLSLSRKNALPFEGFTGKVIHYQQDYEDLKPKSTSQEK